ncbi:type I-E CRISPR-associated protein Cse2/CasB [Streptomyces sp. NPDC005898]|uniref:type I-E CRISPR-associated protein Cse2/CasB n=1 Tax=Streptomyces sp. NPDC005898 TaxID=3157082 RepID=UPI0033E370A9
MTDDMPSSPKSTPRSSSGGGLPRPSLQAPGRATDRCIGRLQVLYRQDNSSATAALARLRRGVGKAVHEAPESWGNDGLEELSAIRAEHDSAEDVEPRGGASAKYYSAEERHWSEQRELAEEKAVFLTITLWALHQQSIRDANMHAYDWGLGRSVRHLAQGRRGDGEPQPATSAAPLNEELSEPIRKRFVRIGTSTSFEMLGTRLREMVLLLRGARLPLDYARLADQLTAWQDTARQAEVRRTWGRDFHLSAQRKSRSETGPAADGENRAGLDDPLNADD